MKKVPMLVIALLLVTPQTARAEIDREEEFEMRSRFHYVDLGVRLASDMELQQGRLHLNTHELPPSVYYSAEGKEKIDSHYFLALPIGGPGGIWISKMHVFAELKKYYQLYKDGTHRRIHLVIDVFYGEGKDPRINFDTFASTRTQAHVTGPGGRFSWRAGETYMRSGGTSSGGFASIVSAVSGCFSSGNGGGRRGR